MRTHALRKTAATGLDVPGVSARGIAEYLGHAKPSLTRLRGATAVRMYDAEASYRVRDVVHVLAAMPPLSTLAELALDPVALLVLCAAAVLYGSGVRTVRRRGERWPVRRSLAFVLLGLGSYAAICFGFLGVHSMTLRWAFVLRVTLLLMLVPALVALGRPVELMRVALPAAGRRRVDALLVSRPLRLLGSAVVAPIVPLLLFVVLLTPAAGALRVSPLGEASVTVLAPLLGLVLTVALVEEQTDRTGVFYTGEFLVAFVELVLDAVPGILMRLSDTVLDGLPHLALGAAAWYPSPLRDQQLAGDLLWMIAELGDLPALVLLFLRWQRSDRREARSFDDLTDEAYAALAADHLKRHGGSGGLGA